jgi:hypothetical protein
MRANAARLAFGGCQSPASIAFIYGNGELPLLKPSKGAILPPNLLESGECRFWNRFSANRCRHILHRTYLTNP